VDRPVGSLQDYWAAVDRAAGEIKETVGGATIKVGINETGGRASIYASLRPAGIRAVPRSIGVFSTRRCTSLKASTSSRSRIA